MKVRKNLCRSCFHDEKANYTLVAILCFLCVALCLSICQLIKNGLFRGLGKHKNSYLRTHIVTSH